MYAHPRSVGGVVSGHGMGQPTSSTRRRESYQKSRSFFAAAAATALVKESEDCARDEHELWRRNEMRWVPTPLPRRHYEYRAIADTDTRD